MCFLGHVDVVRALYNYAAQHVGGTFRHVRTSHPTRTVAVFTRLCSGLQTDELSFEEGDTLYIIDKVAVEWTDAMQMSK